MVMLALLIVMLTTAVDSEPLEAMEGQARGLLGGGGGDCTASGQAVSISTYLVEILYV